MTMHWDKGPLEKDIYSLEQVREQLWRAYTTWSKVKYGGDSAPDRIFYEGYASAIEYMGHLTRFTQLEGMRSDIHFHEQNIEILNDCIQQVKDELG